MVPRDALALRFIADRLTRGQCILFLGAGIHCPPPNGSSYSYPESERPPTGAALSKYLAQRCNYPGPDATNLQRVALYYETSADRFGLIEELRNAVEIGKKPSPLLQNLAELPFPLVATTNYDRLFERAVIDVGKRPFVTVYDKSGFSETKDYPSSKAPTAEEPFIFKIHGDIEQPDSIVITEEDYVDYVLRLGDRGRQYPIPETFLFYLRRLPALFLGYSLTDLNLRAFFKAFRLGVDPARRPPIYCVDRAPDELLVRVLDQRQNNVRFINQDIWRFVPALCESYSQQIGPGDKSALM